MTEPVIYKVTVPAGETPYLMTRELGSLKQLLRRADLLSIQVQSIAKSTRSEVYNANLPIDEVVFDELRSSDERWTTDRTGYNFGFFLNDAAIPEDNEKYLTKVTFREKNGCVSHARWEITTTDPYSTTAEAIEEAAPRRRVEVRTNPTAPCAVIDGVPHPISVEVAPFVQALVEADGHLVTLASHGLRSRDLDRLPPAVNALIDRGTGKGCYISREKLWLS
ncbi:MAG: hypothetical protein K8T91_21835 [Planctomycetes bacterium]|nr:hypothetical protein [Planctomycetota bacterium]